MDTSDQYFDGLCRTCMHVLVSAAAYDSSGKQQQWISIFDRIEEERCSLPIAELLTQAVPQMEVHSRDELPKRICSKCLQQLLSVHRFQQMCLQSEQKMRQQVSKKRPDLEKSTVEAPTVSEIETIDAVSFLMSRFQPTQEPLLETTEQVVKTEPAEVDDSDQMPNIDQSLQHCGDSQGGFREVIKNEPIENDEPSIEYSAGGTMHSIFDVKDEVWSIECEEQQVNEMDVNDHHLAYMFQQKCIQEGVNNIHEACDICGKCVKKKHIKQHKLSHSNDKAHKCDFCDKRFALFQNLRRHMREHTGENPYKCNYCERAFARSDHLMRHMRAHLGKNVYRCQLCPAAFPVASELRVHVTKHEYEDLETRGRNFKALKEAEAMLQLKFSKKEAHGSRKSSRINNL